MYLLGHSLDILSLMALTIASGFVVDDAIVVLENISRHLDEGMPRIEAALRGAREVGFTVLSISLSLSRCSLDPAIRRHCRPPVPRIHGHAVAHFAGDSAHHHADAVGLFFARAPAAGCAAAQPAV